MTEPRSAAAFLRRQVAARPQERGRPARHPASAYHRCDGRYLGDQDPTADRELLTGEDPRQQAQKAGGHDLEGQKFPGGPLSAPEGTNAVTSEIREKLKFV